MEVRLQVARLLEGQPLHQQQLSAQPGSADLSRTGKEQTPRSITNGFSSFPSFPRSGSLIAFLLSESQMESHISAQWKSLLLDFTSHEIAVTNVLPYYRLMCQPSGKGFTSEAVQNFIIPFATQT